jgi:hypothetical protein
MLKILKQELLFIPIMLMVIELFRSAIYHFYPETALFDRGSELESFLFSVWQITWITSASWLLLRIVFPSAFKSLQKFYRTFDDFKDEYKQGFALKVFLTFFFGLVFLLSGKSQAPEAAIRKKLNDTLNAQLHVRELTGKNDGVEVERYLAFVGQKKGAAWCAAFTSYNLNAVGISTPPNPKTAWAPTFANSKYIVWSQSLRKARKSKQPQPGDCFTIFYAAQNRVGHVGFVVDETANYFITIEGNTGLSGTREGSGVHKLKRSKEKVYAVTNYITPYIKSHEKNRVLNTPNPFIFLQKQQSNIRREDQRDKRALADAKGFYLVQRQFAEGGGRESKDSSQFDRGFLWQNKPTGTNSGNGTYQSQRISCKRKAECGVPLQGFGNKGKASATKDHRIRKPETNQTANLNCSRYKGSSLYPEVG